jgi:hypothetical protein
MPGWPKGRITINHWATRLIHIGGSLLILLAHCSAGASRAIFFTRVFRVLEFKVYVFDANRCTAVGKDLRVHQLSRHDAEGNRYLWTSRPEQTGVISRIANENLKMTINLDQGLFLAIEWADKRIHKLLLSCSLFNFPLHPITLSGHSTVCHKCFLYQQLTIATRKTRLHIVQGFLSKKNLKHKELELQMWRGQRYPAR